MHWVAPIALISIIKHLILKHVPFLQILHDVDVWECTKVERDGLTFASKHSCLHTSVTRFLMLATKVSRRNLSCLKSNPRTGFFVCLSFQWLFSLYLNLKCLNMWLFFNKKLQHSGWRRIFVCLFVNLLPLLEMSFCAIQKKRSPPVYKHKCDFALHTFQCTVAKVPEGKMEMSKISSQINPCLRFKNAKSKLTLTQ